MTTGIFESLEAKRSKLEELAYSDEGRRLCGLFERSNFLREALISLLQEVSDECDEAMYNYMNFIGLEISPERLSGLLAAIARNKERKNKK